jgi:hypothetical protein
MEWESNLPSTNNPTVTLKEVEAKLSYTELVDYTSPASIVIFSSLYNIMPSGQLSDYPALNKFFIGFLGTAAAKKGIELAAAHTTEQNVAASTVVDVPNSLNKPTGTGAQHIRPGIFATKLDREKMYTAKYSVLIIVCPFQEKKTFS